MAPARLATVALLLSGLACAAGSFSNPSHAASEARAWTHRITSISGEYVDRWTVDDPRPCGVVGEGSVTVKFKLPIAPRVTLVYSRFAGAQPSGVGSWIVGIPSAHGGGLVSSPPRRVTGTITLVDNTTQRPPEPDDECEPLVKSGCGTVALSRASVRLNGYNRRFLYSDLSGVDFRERGGEGRMNACRIGQTTDFTDRQYSGGTRLGELLLQMPSVSAVARRRVLTVTGTSHKRTATPDCEYTGTSSCTDDVTRRVTVTFRKL